MSVIREIKSNIKSYNRFMTDDYLAAFDPLQLLSFTHPNDRDGFASELKSRGIITEDELKEWKSRKYKSPKIKSYE